MFGVVVTQLVVGEMLCRQPARVNVYKEKRPYMRCWARVGKLLGDLKVISYLRKDVDKCRSRCLQLR